MDDSIQPRAGVACPRTRLAESDVAAVDACECGMMHLHLGPFSLRLTPSALRGLLDTLAAALGTNPTRSSVAQAAASSRAPVRRGQA